MKTKISEISEIEREKILFLLGLMYRDGKYLYQWSTGYFLGYFPEDMKILSKNYRLLSSKNPPKKKQNSKIVNAITII